MILTQKVTKILLLTATLICCCATLPLSRSSMRYVPGSKAPTLKQLETSQSSSTRTNEFPANSVQSLEREMRQVDAATTTTAEVMESSSSHSSSASGEAESMGSGSRQTLEQALLAHYYNPSSGGMDEVTNFFMLFDLYRPRIGPFATTNEQYTQPDEDQAIRQCNSIKGALNTNKDDNDLCHWRFECTYDLNRFPSIIVNATDCEAATDAECIARPHKLTIFTRTFVNNVAHWIKESNKINIVTGFTCRSSRRS